MSRPSFMEMWRAAAGAGSGIALCGLLFLAAATWIGQVPGMLLIAPLGATAFLLFAVPNSPLAQPWSAIVGNGMSALVAVIVSRLGLPLEISAGLAVSGAMVMMSLTRAMHPPGAAVALATILSEPFVSGLGYGFVLAPVILDTSLLVALAVGYNRVTGRYYPFRQPASGNHATRDPAPQRRLGLTSAELAAVLDRYRLSANIGPEDFGRILGAAEAETSRRNFERLTCREIMSRDLITVAPDATLETVADLFRKHRFKSLPVVESEANLRGVVTQNDLIQQAMVNAQHCGSSFTATLTKLLAGCASEQVSARDIMTSDLQAVQTNDGVSVLVTVLADGGVQAVPVLEEGQLVGIVTRSDLVAVLARLVTTNSGSRHGPCA